MRKSQNTIHPDEFLMLYGKTKASNIIKSVVYRWFQLYERPMTPERIESQMELLDDNVKILTSVGAVSGKEQITTIVQMLENRKSSYNIGEINVYPCGVGQYTAQCSIAYRCESNDGKSKIHDLTFEADLKSTQDLTYKFVRIKIKAKGESDGEFKDNYPSNRSISLIHYCMGLIEHNVKSLEVLADCFLPKFEIHPLNFAPIRDQHQLINWIENINNIIQGVAITPVNINVTQLESEHVTFRAEFDLLFEGKDKKGNPRNSLSKNVWILEDNPNDTLPKIKTIRVEKLEPIFI